MRRPSGPLLTSIALHIVAGAALLYVISIPLPFHELFKRQKSSIPIEQVSFLQLPNRGVTTPGRSGGDDRPVRQTTPEPLVTPTATPNEVPPPIPAPAREEEGSGPLVGRGGAVEGVVPSYADSRIWADPNAEVATAPRSLTEDLDSTSVAAIERYLDSARLANSGRRPGDWTYEKNGRKYGLDENNIYLGKVTLPSGVLAIPEMLGKTGLLGRLAGGNPLLAERSRAIRAMTADINYQAQRAMNEDEFRLAVKRIRERKDRERQEEQARRAQPVIP